MGWEKVGLAADVGRQGLVFKKSPKQIAVFSNQGRFYAIDNRCPHEGYPLAEGTVDDDCVLTCNWHNWKFRLDDGECVLGGDHVRSYKTEVRGAELWVDLSPPEPEVLEGQILRGLKRANEDRDYGRICREISRLHYNGLAPRRALIETIIEASDRFEFGTTHAFAAAADWLTWYDDMADWNEKLICLAEPVDHIAFDSLRHRRYPFAGQPAEYSEGRFLEAVESESRSNAEAMIRHGLDKGLGWRELEPAFAQAALAHFNDFGHSAIYVLKAGQLIGQLGSEVLAAICLPLARHLCYTTREDLIPEFRSYGDALDAMQSGRAVNAAVPEELFRAPTRKALAWVGRHYDGQNHEHVYDRLLTAIARNLLHYEIAFDQASDGKVDDNVGWLHLTHGITFSNAVRFLCGRYPHLWPQGLLQMACMLGRNAHYLDQESDESAWFVDDAERFLAAAREKTLDHGFRDPIFSAHLVKTIVAVQEELSTASVACRRFLLAGLNRFLHSPIKQKHSRRLARQAIELVQRDFKNDP